MLGTSMAALALEDYCVTYWLNKLQERMDMYTGCHNITSIVLRMEFNTNLTIINPIPHNAAI